MDKEADLKKSVREYWENTDTISIIDNNLHKIEIDTVCKYLRTKDSLADIGCGNGEATVEYAKKVHKCLGMERSSNLRQKAQENASKSGLGNISIQPGDLLDLSGLSEEFDVIVTQRSLINLSSWEDQQKAILNIHRALKPGGRYIMIENTNDAFLALNDMRGEVGLDPIPQHWHNRFFRLSQIGRFF